MALKQSNKKYLIYGDRIEQSVDEKRPLLHSGNFLWFWSERLILVDGEHTDEFWHFQAVDIMTNESRAISFPKSFTGFGWVRVVPLAKNYGFIVERLAGLSRIYLVKVYWKLGEIQLFEQFERQHEDETKILVDESQPSKLVLKMNRTYQCCELNGGKIKFGNTHELNYHFEHYYDDKLFALDQNRVIRIYDLLLKKTESIQIGALLGYHVRQWPVKWIKYRCYTIVCSYGTINFDIGWTDLKTKRFTLMGLKTTVSIRELKFLNGNLLAFANESKEQDFIVKSEVEIHSIPMRRPNSLRQMAWLLVVQQMKDSDVFYPYKEAGRYLPFNTDLRPPWFTNEIKNEATNSQESLDAEEEYPSQNESSQGSVEETVPPKRHKPN